MRERCLHASAEPYYTPHQQSWWWWPPPQSSSQISTPGQPASRTPGSDATCGWLARRYVSPAFQSPCRLVRGARQRQAERLGGEGKGHEHASRRAHRLAGTPRLSRGWWPFVVGVAPAVGSPKRAFGRGLAGDAERNGCPRGGPKSADWGDDRAAHRNAAPACSLNNSTRRT
jgi:hypothetical protein